MNLSITIRPLKDEFKYYYENQEAIIAYISKKSKDYIVGFEKGQDDEISHYQIHMELEKHTKTSNIRRALMNQLDKYCFMKHPNIGLVIKQVKEDPDYHKGYCLKEQNKIVSSYSKDQLQEYLQYYQEKSIKRDDYDLKNYFKVSRKNIHIQVERFIQNYKKEQISYSREEVKQILSEMGNKGYYIFHIINIRSGSEVIDSIYYYLNGRVDEYINNCDIIQDRNVGL